MAKSTPKTRCNGEWTEAKFWTFIRSNLRRASLRWLPRGLAKLESRRPNESANRRLRWEYQCERCGEWFPGNETEVDHKVPVGSLRCAEDLPGFVERLFCEVNGYVVLCKGCHLANKEEQCM